MKRNIFTSLIALLLSISVKAQSPDISFHSCSPETVLTNTDVELVVTLVNNGDAATGGNINATLTSNDPYLTIVDGTASCASIAAGETAEVKFVVNINQMAPDGYKPNINLNAVLEGSSVETNVYYDFETGIQEWTNIDADGDGFEWIESGAKLGPDYGHESRFCMFSQSYDNDFDILYPDNYLVSPQKFKIGNEGSINFWACAQDMNYPAEHFGVAISTSGNTSDSDFTTIAEWTMTAKDQGNWYEYNVDLSEYENQEIWVAIRHFDCFDEYFLALDDVTFSNVFQPISWTDDFSVESESNSADIVFNSFDGAVVMPGEERNLDITMINNGHVDNLCNTVATLSTNSQYIDITNNTASLNPMNIDATQTASFNIVTDNATPMGHVANFSLNVKPTAVAGEEISFAYNFEKDLNGWTTIDANNDGHYWYHTSETDPHDAIMIKSHSGMGHIMSESYCNAQGPLSPDDYIVSPTLVGVTENTTFSFWACAQDEDYAGEHFGVAVSTTGNTSVEDFTTISEWTLTAKNHRAGNWYQFTVDLGDYAGQFVWLALRHFGSSNLFILCIDDIEINNFVKYEEWNSDFSITIGGESLAEHKNKFEIYPNPASDYVKLSAGIYQQSVVRIYNVLGMMVEEIEMTSDETVINVSDYSPGIYFFNINGEVVKIAIE